MKKLSPNISLVIPCFNEEGNIDGLIKKSKKFLQNRKNQLILVNNGSIDNTKNKIFSNMKKYKNIEIVNIKKNIGFGNGLKKGLAKSKNFILAYTHADLQTDPNDVLLGVRLLTHSDLDKQDFFIKGFRSNKIKNSWSFFDIFLTSSMTIYNTILFRTLLTDINAQPVIFSKKFFLSTNYFPNDMMFDVWIYVMAKKRGLNIKRFNVVFNRKARIYGSGNNDTLIKNIKNIFINLAGSFKLLIK